MILTIRDKKKLMLRKFFLTFLVRIKCINYDIIIIIKRICYYTTDKFEDNRVICFFF